MLWPLCCIFSAYLSARAIMHATTISGTIAAITNSAVTNLMSASITTANATTAMLPLKLPVLVPNMMYLCKHLAQLHSYA